MKKPTLLILHPSIPGHIFGETNADGSALSGKRGTIAYANSQIPPYVDSITWGNIISAMRRGVYKQDTYDLVCVENRVERIGKSKDFPKGSYSLVSRKKHSSTLGQLFAPKKPRGAQDSLRPISEENRYKGRDWEAERPRITSWREQGLSLGRIARRLGVSPSTLSEANKRHGLYKPGKPVA